MLLVQPRICVLDGPQLTASSMRLQCWDKATRSGKKWPCWGRLGVRYRRDGRRDERHRPGVDRNGRVRAGG